MRWTTRRLGDLFKIKHGYAFKGEFFSNQGEFVLLTPGNFQPEGGIKLKGDKEKYYVGTFPKEFILRKGDLLIAMTDLTQNAPILGASALIPESGKFLHNQRLGKIVELDESEIDSHFLFYLFNAPVIRAQVKASATGATVRHTAPDRIYAIKSEIPPIDTQNKIASILSSYDSLIANNARRITILEELAKRIYEEWFVRFRFPGHEKVKMVKSEFGQIPAGWQIISIKDMASIHRGKSYKSAEISDPEGLPFINLKCVDRDGGFRRSGLKAFTGPFKDSQRVFPGDIVIAVTDMTQERRIVARCARIPRLTTEFGVISMDLVKIEPKQPCSKEYLYSMLRWSGFADEVKQHANGANVLHLSPERITEFRCVFPSEEIIAKYTAVTTSLFDLCDALEDKSINLGHTRDLLLPKLISGEIDVSHFPVPEQASV